MKPQTIDEGVKQPYNLPDMSAEDVESVERALGEDAAGPLVDSEEGTSATGSVSPTSARVLASRTGASPCSA